MYARAMTLPEGSSYQGEWRKVSVILSLFSFLYSQMARPTKGMAKGVLCAAFSKVLYMVSCYSKRTRTLTLQNFSRPTEGNGKRVSC